jgi:transposase
MTPEARIAELEAVVAQQREQMATLLERVRELETRLANASKDSHNSCKPLSSDGLGRKTRSLRKKSGKKPGGQLDGQLGHRGVTLRLVAADEVVEQRPIVCVSCQMPLDQAVGPGRTRGALRATPSARSAAAAAPGTRAARAPRALPGVCAGERGLLPR